MIDALSTSIIAEVPRDVRINAKLKELISKNNIPCCTFLHYFSQYIDNEIKPFKIKKKIGAVVFIKVFASQQSKKNFTLQADKEAFLYLETCSCDERINVKRVWSLDQYDMGTQHCSQTKESCAAGLRKLTNHYIKRGMDVSQTTGNTI